MTDDNTSTTGTTTTVQEPAADEIDVADVEAKWKAENSDADLPTWVRDTITKANHQAAARRTRIKELEPLAQEAQAAKDASKSELDKARELATTNETGALDAVRFEVALDKGLTKNQARRLVGKTYDELAADADELLKDLAAGSTPETTTPRVGGRPTERLRPGGGDPEAPAGETDIRKLGERMFTR